MSTDRRETIGFLANNKEFQVYGFSCLMFTIFFLTFNFIDLWNNINMYFPVMTVSLIAGNYIITLSFVIFFLSWILVDQISWLSRALILLTAGTNLVVSGLMIILFLPYEERNAAEKMLNPYDNDNGTMYNNDSSDFDDTIFNDFEQMNESTLSISWIYVLLYVNVFQGLYCLIVGICLFFVLDSYNA